MALAVAGFFALFVVPSMALALLALWDFLHRGGSDGAVRLQRAQLLMLAASGAVALLVLATVGGTGGAPFATQGGWVFLGHGLVMTALGPLGAWLFRRAAERPFRRTIKAAETVPLVLVMLDLVLLFNAAVQAP